MNILFVNNSEINPLNSGIQRITTVLAKAFTARGWNCYGAFFEKSRAAENTLFITKLKLDFTDASSRQLDAFIRKYQIERVIVQECWPLKKLAIVHQALKLNSNCQLFYCYHNKPGKEFVPPSLPIEYFRLTHSSNKLKSLKKLLVALLPSPLYSHLVQKTVRRNYSFIHQVSDKIVLLSASYIPAFLRLAGMKDTETTKFISIGNSLSFPEHSQPFSYETKQKEVLIVGRLSDRQKKISSALKIWQQIEQTQLFKDWRLTIVGGGPDEKYYHHLARKLKLKQILFTGKQDPLPYYERASIFMLTSSYEGFGMVLTEAQQMGVVPIAFDSYPAIHDIIQNQKNGVLIPDHDLDEFARQLMELMKSSKKRIGMASQAQEDCRQFSEENIIQRWITFLTASEPTGTIPQKS